MGLYFLDQKRSQRPSSIDGFTRRDAADLHSALRYYGHQLVEDAAFNMFHREMTPLVNHWDTPEDLLLSCNLFRKIARPLNEELFVSTILATAIPQNIDFNRQEREIMTDRTLYIRECRNLLQFFNSFPDYFNFEVDLIAMGYPCGSAG